MRELSVIITARNEEFLSITVEGVLANKRMNTEVIVICDGNWPEPPIKDHPDVTMIVHSESIGQRAAINEAIKLSKAKYIMKLDAHCIVSEGFDKVLVESGDKLGKKVTQVPRMYNLHAFDWKCKKCGNRWYQGPTPKCCYKDDQGKVKNDKCDSTEFERVMVWKPRLHRKSDHYRFDKDLKFQYWGSLGNRPGFEGDITETMSLLGACFFMNRERYWELGGSEEEWGSWGQQGTEIACKTWFSGGRLVTNRKCWFSHMFRTQGGDFGFPYPQSGNQVERARKKSRDLFLNNKWPLAVRDMKWLEDKFYPIPNWHDGKNSKGIVYYTDNALKVKIAKTVKRQLVKAKLPIVSVSLKPIEFGTNIHYKGKRGYLTMFKQVLAGLEASKADIIFLCEHDWLYHPSHFSFTPNRKDVYYYNWNWWRLRVSDGLAVRYDTSLLPTICAYRELLIKHYKEKIRRIEAGESSTNDILKMGFEPGTHTRKEKVDDFKSESWQSEYPNIDIRHETNLTASRWKPEDFRSPRSCRNWKETQEIPGWGKTSDLILRLK